MTKTIEKIKRQKRLHDGIRCYSANTGQIFWYLQNPFNKNKPIPMGEVNNND